MLHEHVVLLTIEVPDDALRRAADARAEVTHLGKGMHRVVLRYGFMEQPDVPRDLAPLADRGVPVDPMRTSYFVGRNSFVGAEPAAAAALAGEAVPGACRASPRAPATSSACRANRVVELGSRIEI